MKKLERATRRNKLLTEALASGFREEVYQKTIRSLPGAALSRRRAQRAMPGLHFRDLDDLNTQALSWLNTTANPRVHGTTDKVPFTRL